MAYSCDGCGYRSAKWMGFCPRCRRDVPLDAEEASAPAAAVRLDQAETGPLTRLTTGVGEVDRVLGGGLVPGAAVLLGGEPGVGKSTLLLQTAAAVAAAGHAALVVSAEESAGQVALRAERLAARGDSLYVLAEGDVDAVVAAAAELRPALVVVDSIQAVSAAAASGPPGSVGQVRESAARLVAFAKSAGVPVILVGHVTKDGGIAGPKVLEHAVDVVLYLEGDLDAGLRLLRGFKNRFGATHQVGLFEMGPAGLVEMPDPSRALLGDWRGAVPGTVVFPAVEGRRPLLVEIQALVGERGTPQPRRSVRGLDQARVHQIIAVLERHAGLDLTGRDTYVAAVGGVRVRDPAADLAVALALASSLLDVPLGLVAAWGEVGLTGEVRAVPHGRRRAQEAARLGVTQTVSPGLERPVRIEAALAEAQVFGSAWPPRRVVLSRIDEHVPSRLGDGPAPTARARDRPA